MITKHTCCCGKIYDCRWCDTDESYVCPTINSDEDANMCDECLDKFAIEYQEEAL